MDMRSLSKNHLPERFFDRPRAGKDPLRLLVRARNHVDAHQLPDTSGGRRSGFDGGLDRSHGKARALRYFRLSGPAVLNRQ